MTATLPAKAHAAHQVQRDLNALIDYITEWVGGGGGGAHLADRILNTSDEGVYVNPVGSVEVTLGDNDGIEEFAVKNKGGISVFAVDSTGDIQASGSFMLKEVAEPLETLGYITVYNNIADGQLYAKLQDGTTRLLSHDLTSTSYTDRILNGLGESVTVNSGGSVIAVLGDATGVQAFEIQDSDLNTVMEVDSDGNVTIPTGNLIVSDGTIAFKDVTGGATLNRLYMVEGGLTLMQFPDSSAWGVTDATGNNLFGAWGQDGGAFFWAGDQSFKVYTTTNITHTFGDNAGLYQFTVKDSDTADVFVVDSNGDTDVYGTLTARGNETINGYLNLQTKAVIKKMTAPTAVPDYIVVYNDTADEHLYAMRDDGTPFLITHNLTTDIDHDALTGYVAAEHIDWTNATEDLHVTGLVNIDLPDAAGGHSLSVQDSNEKIIFLVSSDSTASINATFTVLDSMLVDLPSKNGTDTFHIIDSDDTLLFEVGSDGAFYLGGSTDIDGSLGVDLPEAAGGSAFTVANSTPATLAQFRSDGQITLQNASAEGLTIATNGTITAKGPSVQILNQDDEGMTLDTNGNITVKVGAQQPPGGGGMLPPVGRTFKITDVGGNTLFSATGDGGDGDVVSVSPLFRVGLALDMTEQGTDVEPVSLNGRSLYLNGGDLYLKERYGTTYKINHNLSTDIDHDGLTNTHNLTTDIDHDALTNFVANEHIDWTGASGNFKTSGTHQLTRGGADYTTLTFVPLVAPLTSTSFDGDSFSDVSTCTVIDLSAAFSAPAGIKAVSVRVQARDSASATTDDLHFSLCSSTSTDSWAVSARPSKLTNDHWAVASGVVPCNADGDIYYICDASGSDTLDAIIVIFGYWI
jgi:hypothetical protein